jgi:hypothetical protein
MGIIFKKWMNLEKKEFIMKFWNDDIIFGPCIPKKKCGLLKMSKVNHLIMFLFTTRLLSRSNLQVITCKYK